MAEAKKSLTANEIKLAERVRELERQVEHNAHTIKEVNKENIELEAKVEKLESKLYRKLVSHTEEPKQVAINLIRLCEENGVKNPESMTIRETKKVEFCLRNVFQEAKGL